MLVLTVAPFVTGASSSRLIGPAYGLADEATAAVTEWAIPTPKSHPAGLALDPSGGCCWFLESSGNKAVHLDPLTDTFREWTIPTPSSNPTSLALTTVSGSVMVFGTETAKKNVFIFFPSTGIFREYTLPSDFSPLYISVEPGGPQVKAWFTSLGNSVAEITYDPSSATARIDQLTLPATAGGGAKGVRATSGVIWFAGAKAIVKWESPTNRFTTWTIPSHASNKAAFVDLDAQGQVWYTSTGTQAISTGNYVGVLRSDNTFTEWQVPTPSASLQTISINPVTMNPWIAEQGIDKVAKLDPSSGGTVTKAQPTTIKADRANVPVFTHVSGPTLPSTVTVAPATITPAMTSSEHFTEWALEAGSGLQDVIVDASGEIWMLESAANKVARLSLAPDFLVECDPSSLDAVQGANVTSTCTVTSVDGFSSTVELAGSWLGAIPDGVAFTLPSPVTPSPGRGVSSILIISAGPRASTGAYVFQVAGTSGSLKHTARVEVMITAGVADFAVVISPSYLSIPPAASGSATVTVQSLGVFFSPVHLTASSMPDGMTVLFDPNPVTPPIGQTTSSAATVNLSGAPQGTYTIIISGSGGSLTRSAALTVQISGSCLIATATYGSELSDEVQLLRNFRDKSIMTTKTGSSFMIAFNAWYYSFSPTVAAVIREHQTVRAVVKLALYPLVEILRIGNAVFHLLPTGQEASAVVTGLIVSSLIGLVYVSLPLAALLTYSARARRVARKLVVSLSATLLVALVITALAVVLDAPAVLMMGATSVIVLTSLAVSALIASRMIMRSLAIQQ